MALPGIRAFFAALKRLNNLFIEYPWASYVYTAFLFLVMLGMLSLDFERSGDLSAYLWHLFWVFGATGWTFRFLYLTNQFPDQNSPQAMLMRRASATVITMTVVGLVVTSRLT